MMEKTKGAKKLWEQYKYVVLVALAGLGLLALPTGTRSAGAPEKAATQSVTEDLERQMEEILANIQGVGQVRVLLTMDSDGERELAQDTELRYSGDVSAPEDYSRASSTVLLEGEGGDESLVVRTVYPTYRGALVVCTGGADPAVKLTVTEAVAALTGLSSGRITVAKWQSSYGGGTAQ